MKHKCKNFSICGGWVRRGDLCDKCRADTKKLESTWQTIEQEWTWAPWLVTRTVKEKKDAKK